MGKIGVYDSGIGGVSVFREIVKLLPCADYFYLSDSKNNPYGDKSSEEILDIVFKNVQFLIEKGCSIIVIACNTATAVAIDTLRKAYPQICFIGTEPAIKIVHDHPSSGRTLLLATNLTLHMERVQNLIQKYPVDNLETYPCSGLADIIESCDLAGVRNYIQEHLQSYFDVSSLVLGCTHYPLVQSIFQEYFPNATIVDGSLGIANQVVRKVEELSLSCSTYNLEFVDTSGNPKKREIFDFYCQAA